MSGRGKTGVGQEASGETFLLFAVVLFGLSIREGPILSIAVLVATLALIFGFARIRMSQNDVLHSNDRWEAKLALAVVVFGAAGALGWSPSVIGPTSSALEMTPGILWAAAGAMVYLSRRRLGKVARIVVVVFTLGLTLTVGLFHLSAAEGFGFDVLLLHMAAADAIADGQSPYTDAVTIPDGAPMAEPDDVIVGYVYPPVTAVFYSVADWTLSDARYTSLIAWVAFLGLFGFAAIRHRGTTHLYMMLLLAAIPGWPLVLRAAWTEPLSLALLGLCYFAWRRPSISGVGLGLALGSKQYFAVAAPLLVLFRDTGWLKKLVIAALVVGTTIGAALVWDAGAFFTAAIEFHTSTAARVDGLNLVGFLGLFGMAFEPSTILTVGAGLVAAVVASRAASGKSGFMLALGVTLASSFLVSSQAFANYWLLVCGLSAMALAGIADPGGNESRLRDTNEIRAAN